MALTQAPKGTKDILPQEVYQWHDAERVMRDVCRRFGFREIRVPTFEHTELFLRGVGDTTDIVQKEMYTFQDKGGRSLTLKPEGTAGVARAFIEHQLQNAPLPQKMYYLNSPVFRYERPQAGRYREHHQFGVEVFGAQDPTVDAEVILLALEVIGTLGLRGLEVHINSIGCPRCRPEYQYTLRENLAPRLDDLCETCKTRYEKNPLRILDCKSPTCRKIAQDAPHMVDCLCDDCRAHFDELQAHLRAMGVDYSIDPFIVRGLDYYTRTVFEIIARDIGAQSTVCGGGRYDGLLAELGGTALPGMGFGMGMERLLMAREIYGVPPKEPRLLDIYVAPLGAKARAAAFTLTQNLRKAGLAADTDHIGRSLKAQMKYADKTGCRYTVLLGEDELARGVVNLRDMQDAGKDQQTVDAADCVCVLVDKIGKDRGGL